MSDSGRALAAAMVLDLRTPLARVALAASELARAAATPTSHALAAGISDAVRDLDRRIDRILPLLAAVGRRSGATEDLEPLLERVARRLRAGLEARGIHLEVAVDRGRTARGDSLLARQCAVELLRAGAARLAEGGSLRLGVERDGALCGIALEGRCEGNAGMEASTASLSRLRAWAIAHGATLQHHPRRTGFAATVWLPKLWPPKSEPCPAS